jgi:DNA-binding beta-propeller fold protein YncE
MRAMRLATRMVLCFLLGACGDDAATTSTPDATPAPDAAATCPRTPAAADRTRFVVLARPYDTAGNASPAFEVLQLTATGTLTRFSPPRIFMLATRAPFGTITFTPDGDVGLVPLDDGKLGVFRLDADGNATVVDAGIKTTFYTDRIVMAPSGDHAWVVDTNTRENGGGIYEIAIGCDGKITERGLLAAAKSPGALGVIANGTRAVVPAREILTGSTAGDDVHLLDWSATPALRGGADAFGDDDSSPSGFAVSHDEQTAFLGDSSFSGPNRVGIVSIGDTDITPLAMISNITDPSGIAASPYGDVAIVTSSQPPGEGIYILDKGGANGTWRKRGAVTYMGAAPQLPGDVVTIDRGQLAGSVLVSELSTVRRLMFRDNGNVDDTGSLAFGDGLENIGGAIGVTP